ncbi:cytochrome b5 [Wolfiporia cocos MD-104 SS10]|uniref:Cytochrome b5 n=1 Tax=Wolfiporia cocos (strain MD-104) TaxID=742152 RepID=A0A2H3JW80_WOLCO|nr:cytochrome b5 [Wolfiporia cocos MD-104 SS10]
MASYLRNWLFSQGVEATSPAPTIIENPPPAETTDDDDTETIHGGNDNDDTPPSFPSLNSAQRLAPSAQQNVVPRILTDSELMPPPPVPSLAARRPGVASSTGSLAVPLTTVKPPPKPSAKRGKVALAPGHGPLDWANLKKSGQDLRGVDTLLRVTPSMLKQHNTREDAWSAFNGRVYNITPYLPYHPGGEKELMRVAGRDGSKLFALTHAWVNLDYMLDACLIGFLVQSP